MATNDESPTVKDYLENVGRDLKLVNEPLPVLAMPTPAELVADWKKKGMQPGARDVLLLAVKRQ